MDANDTLDMHKPAADFSDYLEDAVVGEYRRRRTFRRLRAAAVVVVSIGIGATATFASAQVRESSAKDSLLAAAQADAMLASMQLNLTRMQLAEEQKQVNVGARQAGVLPSEGALREAEAQVARLALNIAEIEATSRAPRDELNAPLVNGRDFVKERLQVQVMAAQQRLKAAQQKSEEVARSVRVGILSPLVQADYEAAVQRRYGELAVLGEQINARRDFLDKGTDIRELSLRVERMEVTQAIQVAQQELRNAQARMNLMEERQKVGAATRLEFLEAQVNFNRQQLELQQLVRRLKELKGD